MTRRKTLAILCAVLSTVAGACPLALADEKDSRRRREISSEVEVHQDVVLDALKRNQIRPLPEVLTVAERVMPGQTIGVKVLRLDGTLVYELKIITERGRLRELYVDAATLELVKVE
jgi:uncharacterized membrane protein YkoI